MNGSDFAVWQENRIEQVWVWFLRLVLLFLPLSVAIRGEYSQALWLALILVGHSAVYVLLPRLLSLGWKRWILSLADIALAGLAFYVGGGTAVEGLLLATCVMAIAASRFALWQALAVNACVSVLFMAPSLSAWLQGSEQFSPRIAGHLILWLAVTWGVNYLASMDAHQDRVVRDATARLRQLSTVNEVGRAIASTLDLETLLHLVLTKSVEILNAQAGSLLLLDDDTGELVFRVVLGPVSESLVGQRLPRGDGIAGAAVETGEGQIVNDVRADSRWHTAVDLATGFETQSILCVPLTRRGRPIGALEVINRLDHSQFDNDDLELLSNFGIQAAVAVENARLYGRTDKALGKRVHELATIEEVSRELSSSLDLERTLDLILLRVRNLVDYYSAEICLWDQARNVMVTRSSAGDPQLSTAGGGLYQLDEGYTGWIARHKQRLFIPDTAERPDVQPKVTETRVPIRSYVGLPLRTSDAFVGTLELVSDRVGAFAEKDLEILEIFANHAAAAIQNARLHAETDRRLQEFTGLHQISQTIGSLSDLGQIYAQISERIARLMGAEMCGILLYDEDVQALVSQPPFFGVPGEVVGRYRLPVPEGSLAWQLWRESDFLLLNDVEREPLIDDLGMRGLARAGGLRDAIFAPLVVGQRRIGVIQVGNRADGTPFGEDDVQLLCIFAGQAAAVVENAKLYEQTDERLQSRLEELEALQRTMEELNATLELDHVLGIVLESAVQTTRATHGNVMLLDVDSGSFLLRAASGYSEDQEAGIEELLLDLGDQSLVMQVAQSGEARNVEDTELEAGPVCIRGDTRSALAVPVLYQGAVVGVINLRQVEVGAFDADDLVFVQALAEQAAMAIGNAMRYEEQVRVNKALRQRSEQMDGLLAVSQKLRTDVQLEDTLEEVAYAIQETVGYNIVLISVVEEQPSASPMLRRVAAAGLPLDVFEGAKRVLHPLDRYEGLLREQYRQGQCYFLPFQEQDDWGSGVQTIVPMPEIEDWREGEWHPHDMLLAPMRGAGGRLLGHISVDEPRDGMRPSRRTLEVLAIFANQAAIAVENAGLYADARRRAEDLALINEVGQTLTQLVEPEQVLNTVVKAVGLLLQCEMGAIFQPDPFDGKFGAVASYGIALDALIDFRYAPGEGLVGKVAEEGSPLVIPDTEQEPLFVRGPVPIGSMMLVPIKAGQRVIGVLTASSPRPFALSEADAVVLVTLADQAAVALESTRLLSDTQQAAMRLASLNEIGRRVSAQLELQDMLETTVDSLQEYLAFYRVGIFLVEEASSELRLAVANEALRSVIPPGYRPRVGEGAIGQAAASGETVLESDALADDQTRKESAWTSPSTVSVPIKVGQRVIGVLEVGGVRRGAFSEQDASALEIAADQLAVAMENARLFEQTQRRLAELATVNEIGRAISGALDTDQLAELIYDQVSSLLNIRNFYLAVYDTDARRVHLEFAIEHGQRREAEDSGLGQGLMGHLIRTGEPILLSQGIEEFAEEHGLTLDRVPAKSWLGVPMIAGDRVIGAIAAQSFEREDAFDQAHLELLTIVAGQASVAYHNASLFQERLRRIEQLNVLNEMAQAISSTLELDELLSVVYQQATRIVDTNNFFIALYDEGTEEITFPFVIDPEHREDWSPRKKGVGLTGTIVATGRPLLLPTGAAGRYREEGREVEAGLCRSWLGVPMIAEDKVLGVIAVQDYEREGVYHEEHLSLLSTVAAQAAVAVRNAQLYRQLVGFSSELERMVEVRTGELEQALAELTVERDRVEALYEITSELGATLELERVLQRALQLFASALSLDHGTILLVDQESGTLNLRATLESGRRLPREGAPTGWKPGVGLAGWVLEHREPALVADIREDARWVHRPGKEFNMRSVVAAPLSLGGGDILGVIVLGHPEPGHFTLDHLQLITAAAAQIAMSVNNSDLYAFITDQADQLGAALQAQQEEAAKNRGVLESIADGVLVLDHNGRVLLVNPAAEELLGFAGMALEGEHFRHMLGLGETEVHRELSQALYSELLKRLEVGENMGPAMESSVRLQAGTRVLAVTLAPLIISPGGTPGLVAALRDISREAEVERLKNEFISTVSHELRTPMTSIKGYTDLLFLGMAGGLTDAQRNFLKIIKSNADRLTALVNDILDISRIETGRMRLTIGALDLGQIISQIVVSFQGQYREKGLTLHWEEPQGLPDVRGDAARVAQVLSNLIANAWQYTPAGGTVTVSVDVVDGFLQTEIRDTGIGISPDDVGRIFDRFYRADHPMVQEAEGTGLGLSIVKMFVEMLGGEIWVESELGQGTMFSFTLPLTSTELPEPVPDLLSTELSAGIARRQKILVVEDDRDLALLLRRQLESEGFQVLLAGTGEDALWLAKEAQPQLITLDIMLPDIDGFAVLERLKTNPMTSPIPVVIVSVLAESEKGFALGAVDYVVKPFVEQELLDVVHRALSYLGTSRPHRLVVADDDLEVLSRMEQALTLQGYEVWTAADGQEALDRAQEVEPDLVLVDVAMPVMDGYEVVRRLKDDDKTRPIPVIVATDSPTDREREKVTVLGMDIAEYLTKPLSIEILIREIKKVIAEKVTV
jgi:PAS domain S-box-containing protein